MIRLSVTAKSDTEPHFMIGEDVYYCFYMHFFMFDSAMRRNPRFWLCEHFATVIKTFVTTPKLNVWWRRHLKLRPIFGTLVRFYCNIQTISHNSLRIEQHVELGNGLRANVRTNLFLAKSHFPSSLSLSIYLSLTFARWHHAQSYIEKQRTTSILCVFEFERAQMLKKIQETEYKICVVIIILISYSLCANVPGKV